jgi:hypothetical protein
MRIIGGKLSLWRARSQREGGRAFRKGTRREVLERGRE